MTKDLAKVFRRGLPVVLAAGVLVLTAAACNDGGTGNVDDATSVPTTAVPANPTTSPDATATKTTGSAAVSLEDVQAFVIGIMPDVSADDVTDVQFDDGKLTVETTWDDTRAADAETLCDRLLTLPSVSVSSAEIMDADGHVIASCGS